MSPSASGHRERLFAARLSLIGAVFVLGGKLAAWSVTGSTAVLSDALESVVNVAAGALVLYTIWLAAAPADRNHPYGHGKVEFFSVGVEGALVLAAAGLILVEAGRALWRGPQLQHIDLGLGLVLAFTAINAALGTYLVRVGRATDSRALIADGRHLYTDVVTSLGVVVGLLLVRFSGWLWVDPLVAIAVALNVMRTGTALLREAVSGLMDEADEGRLGGIVAALEERRDPAWIDVHSLRAWRSGASSHVDFHVVVPRYFDVEQLHGIDERLCVVAARAAGGGDAIVHFDPCRPRHCSGCRVEDCAVRSSPFVAREPFSLERAIRGDEGLDSGLPLEKLEE